MSGSEEAEDLRKKFRQELEEVTAGSVLNPSVRKRKLILWFIRNIILAILYIVFWKYEWVRWSLWITVPLSFLSLVLIPAWNYLLRYRMNKVNRAIDEMERALKENENRRQEGREED